MKIARMRISVAALLLACLGHSTVLAQCAPAPDSPYFFRNLAEQRLGAEEAAKPPVAGRRFFSISNFTLIEHRQGYTVASYLLTEGVTRDGQAQVVEKQMREVYEVVDGQWRLSSVEAAPAPAANHAAP
jgi:hypothetical protein